jgi:hypothetical protein
MELLPTAEPIYKMLMEKQDGEQLLNHWLVEKLTLRAD